MLLVLIFIAYQLERSHNLYSGIILTNFYSFGLKKFWPTSVITFITSVIIVNIHKPLHKMMLSHLYTHILLSLNHVFCVYRYHVVVNAFDVSVHMHHIKCNSFSFQYTCTILKVTRLVFSTHAPRTGSLPVCMHHVISTSSSLHMHHADNYSFLSTHVPCYHFIFLTTYAPFW